MKKIKKAVLAAAVFSAALNFSACAYGPPPDEMEYEKPNSAGDEVIELQNEAPEKPLKNG